MVALFQKTMAELRELFVRNRFGESNCWGNRLIEAFLRRERRPDKNNSSHWDWIITHRMSDLDLAFRTIHRVHGSHLADALTTYASPWKCCNHGRAADAVECAFCKTFNNELSGLMSFVQHLQGATETSIYCAITAMIVVLNMRPETPSKDSFTAYAIQPAPKAQVGDGSKTASPHEFRVLTPEFIIRAAFDTWRRRLEHKEAAQAFLCDLAQWCIDLDRRKATIAFDASVGVSQDGHAIMAAHAVGVIRSNQQLWVYSNEDVDSSDKLLRSAEIKRYGDGISYERVVGAVTGIVTGSTNADQVLLVGHNGIAWWDDSYADKTSTGYRLWIVPESSCPPSLLEKSPRTTLFIPGKHLTSLMQGKSTKVLPRGLMRDILNLLAFISALPTLQEERETITSFLAVLNDNAVAGWETGVDGITAFEFGGSLDNFLEGKNANIALQRPADVIRDLGSVLRKAIDYYRRLEEHIKGSDTTVVGQCARQSVKNAHNELLSLKAALGESKQAPVTVFEAERAYSFENAYPEDVMNARRIFWEFLTHDLGCNPTSEDVDPDQVLKPITRELYYMFRDARKTYYGQVRKQ